MDKLIQFLGQHGQIMACEPKAFRASFAAEPRRGRLPRVTGGIAVLSLQGTITQKMGYYTGTSTDRFGAAFDAAINNSDIGAVVIDADSPGGTVFGTPELSAKIHAARGTKPIVAVANSMAASAGFWIASSADQLIVSPSGEVGSIGVWMAHVDESKWLDELGFDVSLISAGDYKVEGNPFEPLTDDARAEFQRGVDVIFGDFVEAVARNYGIAKSKVRSDFGDGRMIEAKRAAEVGMAHGVDTLQGVLGRMASNAKRGRRADDELTSGLVAAWKGQQTPKVIHPPIEQLRAMRTNKERRQSNN